MRPFSYRIPLELPRVLTRGSERQFLFRNNRPYYIGEPPSDPLPTYLFSDPRFACKQEGHAKAAAAAAANDIANFGAWVLSSLGPYGETPLGAIATIGALVFSLVPAANRVYSGLLVEAVDAAVGGAWVAFMRAPALSMAIRYRDLGWCDGAVKGLSLATANIKKLSETYREKVLAATKALDARWRSWEDGAPLTPGNVDVVLQELHEWRTLHRTEE